jgi:hypothetical protein
MLEEHWENYVFNLTEIRPGSARKKFRAAIKSEWGCCAYCGRDSDDRGFPLDLTIDHVRPRVRGGSSMRSNLVPACVSCNHAKGSNDWRAWFSAQSFFCAHRAARIAVWIQPFSFENFNGWQAIRGKIDERQINSGTVLPLETDSTGSERLVEGGTNQRATCLLGGAISAEASLHGEQSVGWLCFQTERGWVTAGT